MKTKRPLDVTPRQLEHRLAEGVPTQIVDVRSPGEYAQGHVPGALNVPLEELESRLADLDPRHPLVVVCASGLRAAVACERLPRERLQVWRLEGGTEAWIREGLPVVRSELTRWSLERQVRLTAGLLVLTGSALALTLSPLWAILPLLLGVGLTFAGLTDQCGMALLLTRMRWNRR